jgi:hypothetical protein
MCFAEMVAWQPPGAGQLRSAPGSSECVSNRLFLGGLLPSRAPFRFTSHTIRFCRSPSRFKALGFAFYTVRFLGNFASVASVAGELNGVLSVKDLQQTTCPRIWCYRQENQRYGNQGYSAHTKRGVKETAHGGPKPAFAR